MVMRSRAVVAGTGSLLNCTPVFAVARVVEMPPPACEMSTSGSPSYVVKFRTSTKAAGALPPFLSGVVFSFADACTVSVTPVAASSVAVRKISGPYGSAWPGERLLGTVQESVFGALVGVHLGSEKAGLYAVVVVKAPVSAQVTVTTRLTSVDDDGVARFPFERTNESAR